MQHVGRACMDALPLTWPTPLHPGPNLLRALRALR